MSATIEDWKTAARISVVEIGPSRPWPEAAPSELDAGVRIAEPNLPMPEAKPERQVLVLVDDDADDLFLLKRALRKADVSCPIYSAADGMETLRLLSQLEPRVASICLVLDVKLPDVSGFELFDSIRTRPSRDRMKVAFLTGNRQPRLRARAQDCGADRFFTKPSWQEDWSEVACALRDLIQEGKPVDCAGHHCGSRVPAWHPHEPEPSGGIAGMLAGAGPES